MGSKYGRRDDTARLTLVAAGASFGVWADRSGGGTDSEESLSYPGGMDEPESIGGRKVYEPVTLGKPYDHGEYIRLDQLVGTARCEVIEQPLDAEGNPFGASSIAWAGTLKKVTPPDRKASGTDEALMEIEITVDRKSGT